jgi:hypothetical protein
MPPESEGRITRWGAYLTVLVLLLTFQPSASADIPFFESRGISWGGFWSERFEAEEGDTISVVIESYPYPVDVLVFDEHGYSEYNLAFFGNGTADLYGAGSRLDVTYERYSFRIPQDGTYLFVVDNSHLPIGGAYAGTDTNFSVSAEITFAPEPLVWTPGYGLVPLLVIAILVIVVVLGLVMTMLFGKKKKKKVMLMPYLVPAYGRPQELVTCSKCGNPVRKGNFCEKCGGRLQ